MKRLIALMLAAMLALAMLAAAVADAAEASELSPELSDAEAPALADGVYTATFTTGHSMFRVNEAYDGKGILTVRDGEMTIHVTLVSKNIVNLFFGLAEDAKQEGAALLEPTTDEVVYSDGTTGTAYGFDIPVPVIGEPFDVALIGKKGKWYDHKVTVTDPEPVEAPEGE